MTRQYRLRQDRSRKSGHAHNLNTQDYAALRYTMPQRAAVKFCNVVALLPRQGSAYYTELPPAARMAVDACKRVAATLEGAVP